MHTAVAGWCSVVTVTYVSAEVATPRRSLPLLLLLAVAVVAIVTREVAL